MSNLPVYTRATMSDMSENQTPPRLMRIDDVLWEAFGRLAGTRNRSRLVRDFIAWYTRQPGAKLPQRPPASPHDADS